MTVDELKRRLETGDQPEPEIHSVEGILYFVRIDDDTLTASRDRQPLRFPSAHAAGHALGQLGISRGWLIHSSPYDEMIGRSDEGAVPPAPLRTPLGFPSARGARS